MARTVARTTITRLLGAYLACLVAFALLSVISYAIPTAVTSADIGESLGQIGQEGLYFRMLPEDESWTVDNYTVAIMLNEASHRGENPVASAAYNFYWRGDNGDQQGAALQEGLKHPVGNASDASWVVYGRYWHGYLVILKPLLAFLNLYQIRSLFALAMAALLGYATVLVSRRLGAPTGVLFLLCFCLVHIPVVAVSLPFSFSFFVALLAVVFVLRHDEGPWALDGADARPGANGGEGWRWSVFYLVVGGLTVYLDFLDTPIVTLGLPLTVQLAVQGAAARGAGKRTVPLRRTIAFVLVCSLSWCLGYLGLMLGKWVLSSLVTGYDFVGDGIGSVRYRSSDVAGSGTITRSMAILRNVDMLVERWLLVVCVILLALALAWVEWQRHRTGKGSSDRHVGWRQALPVLLVCAYPYVWYALAANHSYIHAFITYRDQVVSLVGLALIVGSAVTAALQERGSRSAEARASIGA